MEQKTIEQIERAMQIIELVKEYEKKLNWFKQATHFDPDHAIKLKDNDFNYVCSMTLGKKYFQMIKEDSIKEIEILIGELKKEFAAIVSDQLPINLLHINDKN